MSKATSIRIFLVDGDSDGFRIVEKSNWTGQAVVVSRTQYPDVRKRSEFDQPGVYVLTGPADQAGAKPRIYIGESDVLRGRLDQHVKTKDFWTHLVAFTGKDLVLNKTHFRFLESRLVERATKAKAWTVENANVPQLPNLSQPDVADAEWFLGEMLIIYPILGIDAFDIPEKTKADTATLRINGPAAEGRGQDDPDGFVVFEGSLARMAETDSFQSWLSELRADLVKEHVLAQEGESYRFAQDYRFKSPSTAASVVLGRNANGREEWKAEDGRTLKAIQDAAVS